MKKNYLFTLIFALIFSLSYSQTTYYVATSANGGSVSNDGTTEATPMLTLSAAISAASSGDTIIVGPGTFSDRALTVSTNITIQGHGREETIFSNTTAGGFMAINADVTLKNMTIKNYESSQSTDYGGGALRLGGDWGTNNTTSPRTITLENIKFFDNESAGTGTRQGDGGAILIVDNRNTTANHVITINECLFYDNRSDQYGGVIFSYEGTTLTINNSVFVDNLAASWAGAIYMGDGNTNSNVNPTLNINNCTFYRNYSQANSSRNSGAIRGFNSLPSSDTIEINVKNSIVYYNIAGSITWSGVPLPDWIGTHFHDDFITYTMSSRTLLYLPIDFNAGNGGSGVTFDLYNTSYSSAGTGYYLSTNMGTGEGISFTTSSSSTAWPGIGGGSKIMWPTDHDDDSSPNYNDGDMPIYSDESTATNKDVDGVDRPQGSYTEVGAYEYRNTWTGAVSSDWDNSGNWTFDAAPDNSATNNAPVITDDGDYDPEIDDEVDLDHLLIRSGTLTIKSTGSLKLTGNLINNGTLNMESTSSQFSSLIVQGESYGLTEYSDAGEFQTSVATATNNTGDITYKRYVNSLANGSGWDLIGSPVEGLQISSFVSTNVAGSSPLATGNGSGAGASGEYAIGTYDSSNNTWTNYTSSSVGSTEFTLGKGYQMATDSGAALAFTGSVDTQSSRKIAIQDYYNDGAGSGSRFTLISNPYPSYITIGPNTTSNTFLEVNDDVIDDYFVGVYGYDANTDGDGVNELFDIYNNTSSAKIAPGQAFMVAARSTTAANITFKEEMQTVSGTDDFISGDVMENTEVELRIYNGDTGVGKTRLFYDEGLGMDLDRGWDAGHYNQNSAIMTRLVEEDEGHGMAINAMGLDAMDNAVIPLVINQAAGQEFRINLHTATIPDPNVYLEDVEEGTFTNLYEGDFVYTPTSDLEGVGRFFIHMSADTMSNGEVSTSMLNAYKEIDASYITIEGLATQSNETNVSLYNILGRKVLSTTLNNNMGTQTISTVGLSTGIYVIELESGTDRLTKKLLIQ